jgi:GGDEF domain-containing protein
MQNKKIAQKQSPKGPQQDTLQLKQKRAATLADAAALFNPSDSRGTFYCVPHKNCSGGGPRRRRQWLFWVGDGCVGLLGMNWAGPLLEPAIKSPGIPRFHKINSTFYALRHKPGTQMANPIKLPIIAFIFTLQTSILATETTPPSTALANQRQSPSQCIAQLRQANRVYLRDLIENDRIERVSEIAEKWRDDFLKRNPEYYGLTEEELKRISHEVLAFGEGYLETIFSIGELSLVKVMNAGGQTILKMRLPSEFEGLEGIYYDRPLTIDSKTQAIDANTPEGKQLAEAFVKQAPLGTIVIFADLNFLGKVNYFEREYIAGDEYLVAFGKAMRNNLRLGKGGDLMLKIGGDEFVFLLPVREGYLDQPQGVQALLTRIVQSVHQSGEAQAIFTEQRRALARDYRMVNNAESFADLTDNFLRAVFGNNWSHLKDSMSFDQFQDMYLELQLKKIINQSNYAASVSVGGAILLPGAEYRDGLIQATSDARAFKILYKEQLGFSPEDREKYGAQVNTHLITSGSQGKERQNKQRRRSDKFPIPFSPKQIKPDSK